MPALVISLDFELFWGVTDSRTIENYGANIEGVWQAIPAMLKLFRQYDIHATWATVGMLMCKDFKQWSDLRPSVMPTYARESCSTYSVLTLARDFPKLFFAPTLVEQILATDGQELASHTYSHFYCGEADVTVEQFAADLNCVKRIFAEYGVKPTSLVFPRNQVRSEYLKALMEAGFTVYRGNQAHRLYQEGHLVLVPYGTMWRLVRVADAYLPLTGNHVSSLPSGIPSGQLLNIPASKFLRPVSKYPLLNWMHANRVKSGMLEAAKAKSVFHLWWHPHNFGRHTGANLTNLEELLKYYQTLNQKYGMRSLSMRELETSCKTH
jgi:peptidoglycan/xylan/chitin deacetylase (PgdA/CDA1 family)